MVLINFLTRRTWKNIHSCSTYHCRRSAHTVHLSALSEEPGDLHQNGKPEVIEQRKQIIATGILPSGVQAEVP